MGRGGARDDRVANASDRTQTPEEIAKGNAEDLQRIEARRVARMNDEIAKEETEDLQRFETRRVARMNDDFDSDDFSNIEEDDKQRRWAGRGARGDKKKDQNATPGKNWVRNDDELDDSEPTPREPPP